MQSRLPTAIAITAVTNVSSYVFYCKVIVFMAPYGIGQVIIFLPCGFYLSSFFFSSPNLSGRRFDVYHTSTHDVAFVRI